jgi:hypothetical protein
MLALMRKVLATLTVLLVLSTSGSSSADGEEKKAGFVYARIRYHFPPYSRFRELPWHHDYPYGDEMFPDFVQRVSNVHTTRESYQIVDIDSPELFKYPFAYMCEPGYLDLLPNDVKMFREYLDRGGFVLVDDFRGYRDLENLRVQLKKVYPDRDLVPLDINHEIFHAFYDIETLDYAPPYGNEPLAFFALMDPKGNIQMIVNYNNDLSEMWEWLDRGEMSLQHAVTSLRLGANYLVYSMTH